VSEREIDRLYGLPLGDFVRARNALAARLRKAGRHAQAAEVARLRKPSPPVWAINQLARDDPGDVDRLVQAVDRLKAAQLGRAAADDLAAAAAAEREALEAVGGRAAGKLGEPVSPAARARVSRTLLAAATDARHRADLRRGRLRKELAPPGFEVFAGARPARRKSNRGLSMTDRRAAARRQVEVARARVALHRARTEAKPLAHRAAALERRAAGARRVAELAALAAERARREAEQAAARAEAAERALGTAEQR